MALLGTIVNALAIIVGGFLGIALPRLRTGVRTTVMDGIGIAVCVLGISMALQSTDFLIVIVSLVAGGIAGELLQIDHHLQNLGVWVEKRVGASGQGRVAEGFVTTTLIYCVGAMAILGALDGGMRHNHDILYTKAMLDGFSAVIFASTLGVGVVLSAVPVFLYQGSIALAATWIASLVDQSMLTSIITELTAVGGALILGIGLNILKIKSINVANLLPALIVAACAVPFVSWVSFLLGAT